MTQAQRRVLLVVKGLDLGGVERIVVDLAVGLRDAGHEVSVALVNPRRAQLIPTLVRHDIQVHDLGGHDRVGLRALRSLRQLVREQRPSVVHAHGPLPAVAAVLVGGNTPIVASVHSMWASLRAPSRALLRLALPRTAGVVAVSAAVRSSLPAGLQERTTVIGHGVHLDACAVAATHAPPGMAHEVRVVTVASHRKVKNYGNLLRAFARARVSDPRLQLTAVGDGPARAAHEALARELGITDAVTFEPANDNALCTIAAAEIFVLASDLEGQPIVLLEAMAMGRAVIATSVGRAPELINDDNGRLVAPGDPVALANALCELAADDELRGRLGAAAATAAAEHTVERAVREHLDLYATIERRGGVQQ